MGHPARRSVRPGTPRRGAAKLAAAAVASACLIAGSAWASHQVPDTLGDTTLEQVLAGTGATTYKTLTTQAVNASYLVRDPAGVAQADRDLRRKSLAYFAQLTDFQLADEESPARVEFADQGAGSAWRPQEAFHPFAIDWTVRQVNQFAAASPVPQGNGTPQGGPGNAMDFTLLTGDQADNQQRNETIWVRELMEGGTPVNFNSGSTDLATYQNPASPFCTAFVVQEGNAQNAVVEAGGYTGVQDYSDWPPPGPNTYFYDPNSPQGTWATEGWPTYTGLMDRAQQLTITPQGLATPFYVTNGNHDVLVQGNEDANASFEAVAMGCQKVVGSTAPIPPGSPGGDPNPISFIPTPDSVVMLVPPDSLRRFVSKPQLKSIFAGPDNGHGFGFVDPGQNTVSNQSASYYAWDPPQTPGFRFISIDTNSEGGVVASSSEGNIDDPQFDWLTAELDAAQAAGKLIVVFGHHPVRTLISPTPDEQAAACSTQHSHGDTPEHDQNPGCDLDPRQSEPLHLGDLGPENFVELLDGYPNVIAYVSGHTHENKLIPFTRTDNSVWWEVNTAAVADEPQQSRLVDIMDNRDGTLSIFGTVLDHGSPSAAPAPGSAKNFTSEQLASIGRTFAFNDAGRPGLDPDAERNVEMLVADPRKADLKIAKADSPDPVLLGGTLTYTLTVTNEGPSEATGVEVTDTLPGSVTFGSATASQGSCSETGGTVTCDLGDIPDNAVRTVTIQVTPNQTGSITNNASVDGILDDPDGNDDSATQTTTVNPVADLAISKSDSPDPVPAGDQLTYTLSLSNGGPSDATGVTVTDNLPPGAESVSATPSQGTCSIASGTVTCALGTIADGGSASVQIQTTPQGQNLTITNQADVSSAAHDPATGNNTDSETTFVEGNGAPAFFCDGRQATIVGTTKDDRGANAIEGTPGPDVIVTLDGQDQVAARAGPDLICGNGHADTLRGNRGADRILGKWDADDLFGGADTDVLLGGKGPDDLDGGGGSNDRCRGEKGADVANRINCEIIRDAVAE